jgi:hypothetical protein
VGSAHILGRTSLVIFIFGAATLFNGEKISTAPWGGIVFAPVAIIVGLLGLIIAATEEKEPFSRLAWGTASLLAKGLGGRRRSTGLHQGRP